MKPTPIVTVGFAALAAILLTVYILRSDKIKRMLTQISDEGYETANDILFPEEKIRGKKLHYGPVLPG